MSQHTLHLKINGAEVEVPEGTTILKAAELQTASEIPTLCNLKA